MRCVTVLVLVSGLLASAVADEPKPTPAPLQTIPTQPVQFVELLRLAQVAPLDIQRAAEQVRLAEAQFRRTQVQWYPTVFLGADYYRHDGQIQDIVGNILSTSRSALQTGAGAALVFQPADALVGTRAAGQVVRAQEAGVRVAHNDTLFAVAEAYVNLQQARADFAVQLDVLSRLNKIVATTEQLAQGLIPALEVSRARTELARQRLALPRFLERQWGASAELARLLRLDASLLIEPQESPLLKITLVDTTPDLQALIAQALASRPELARQQALLQAARERVRQEGIRPWIPSVALRGSPTPPGYGVAYFGGGVNDQLGHFGSRADWTLNVNWELQNLGLGNHARRREREAEANLATIELAQLGDRISADVASAYARVKTAEQRLADSELLVKEAQLTLTQNLEGMTQTKRAGNVVILVVRPQEVLSALSTLAAAYQEYNAALGDYNRSQFQLFRAVGTPAPAAADTLHTTPASPLK